MLDKEIPYEKELRTKLEALTANVENDQLKLYTLMLGYESDGVAYYYKNHAAFKTELSGLTAAINDLWPSDKAEQDTLVNTLKGKVPAEYADKIDSVIALLDSIKPALNTINHRLTAPNENIDTDKTLADLKALVDALAATGKATYNAAGKMPMITTKPEMSPSKDAEGFVSIEVFVQYGGEKFFAESLSFPVGYVLTENDIKNIEQAFGTALDAAKAKHPNLTNTALYTYTKGDRLEAGTVMNDNVSLSDTYTIKNFTVHVPGQADQSVNAENGFISLPASTDPNYRYDYYIDGVKVNSNEYTFTAEQLQTLFVNGEYTVTLDPVNLADEKIDKLNKDLGEYASIVKDPITGGYVMNINVPLNNPSALSGVAQALVLNGGYTYIELNDETLLQMAGGNIEMFTQTLINVMMASNVGSDKIIEIAENGGGTLFTAKMALGTDKDNIGLVTTLNLNLTGELAELNAVADALKNVQNYAKIGFTNTGMTMTMTLPEKAYQAYLAGMILMDQRNLKDLNEINGKVAFGYIQDVIDPVMTDPNLDLDTFVNTLKVFGYNVDASAIEPYFGTLVSEYNAFDWEYSDLGMATALVGGQRALDVLGSKLPLGNLPVTILFKGSVEKPDEVNIPVELKLTNLATDYEAVFADVKADGITNKFGMTTDLSGKKFADKAIVVLLADIEDSVSFSATTVLDLNGFTIKGNVSCSSGTLYIVDSSLDNVNVGGVEGKVNGNVVIAAGTYKEDISKYVSDGYTQENGTVKNRFYTIEKDVEGNYTVTLIAGAISRDNLPNIKTMALDILMDLVFNIYNKGAMWIDGNLVYDIALENIVELYETEGKLDALLDAVVNGSAAQDPWFDVAGLAKIYNQLVADLTDFDNIANEEYLGQYILTTAPWELNIFVDGDHVSAGAGALANTKKDTTITIKLSDDDKADSIRDVAAELDQILDIKSHLEMSQIKNGSTVKIEAIYSQAEITIDLSKHPVFMEILGKLLANVVTGNKLTALNTGLNTYKTHGTVGLLKKAIDACTVSDLLTALAEDNASVILSSYHTVFGYAAKILGAAIRRLDIQDKGNRTFGSMLRGEFATYVLDKENMNKIVTRTLRGYTLSVDASVPYASVTVILCGDCDHANVTHVGAKGASCTEDGNIEY